MGRSPCCAKEGLKRGAWTATEDKILSEYIKIHGEGKWRNLPKRAGLKRCGKSCRLRWLNYLRPDIKRGNITSDEEDLIIRLHNLLGNRWSLIAGRLPGRTDNEIKNYWNTKIQKKLHKDSKHKLKESILDDLKESSDNNHYKPIMLQSQRDSCVIRPKPTRCTKTVISHDDELVAEAMVSVPMTCDSIVNENKMEMSSNLFPSSDFMLDWDLDGSYLSDILNKCFVDMEDNGDATGSKSGLASNDDQTLSLEDSKNVSDFQQIGTSIESDSDWF